MDLKVLQEFHLKATTNTYIGGGEYDKLPERKDFLELSYSDGDFLYKDSYTGFYRSWGTEIIRFKSKLVWCCEYGGGMKEGKESEASEVFNFLKKAMMQKPLEFSARGPKYFKDGEYEYRYEQNGDITHFNGVEEILKNGEVYFTHRVIGGLILDKDSI